MTRQSRYAIWLCTTLQLCAATGCTSMRSPEVPASGLNPAIIKSSLKVGEPVRILTTSGETLKIKVTEVDDSAVTGIDWSGDTQRVEFSDVDGLKIRELSVGKSVALASAGIGAWLYVMISIAPAAILTLAAP